ncbi:TonB-dependent receptor [Nitrospirillum viridazoti Y2]|uniref:Iron complex outermembrane receptor protein n=1 Tax=Nitrospirillum amazonense TaxID=28077 RepID=A0A560HNW6_9PROT|nr:TonB-dependent receptor [Nitrospirillum amazonense]EGY02482.1 TonB-dependent receptor [Nitrospirillum amazonense Y2]TWB46964.1 iron complex outermembrane receptor protein [Nitrospirillum amazonense]
MHKMNSGKPVRTCRTSVIALCCVFAAGSAHAQATTGAAPDAAGQSQATQPGETLQEIVITARYRSETQQQVPIALSVLSGEALAERGVTSLTDAAKGLPNAEFIQTGAQSGNAVGVVIRGVGQTDASFTLQPGVGYYVDDVYQGTLFGQQLGLLDVASVQILRGPQGTLAGRNSEGGAVKIYTAEPKGDDSGYAEMGVGSYSRRLLRGAYDFSLVPNRLFVRVSGGYDRYDGYTTRYDYGCLHSGSVVPAQVSTSDCKTGTEGGDEAFMSRVSARAIISDKVQFVLNGEVLDTNGEPGAGKTVAITTTVSGVPTIAGLLNSKYPGLNYGSSFLTKSLYTNYDVYGYFLPGQSYTGRSYEPQNDIKSRAISGILDWDITDSMQLKSITGWRQYTGTFSAANTAPYGSFNYQILDHEQVSEELRLSGKLLADKLDWTLGGFFYDSDGRTRGENLLSGLGNYFTEDEPSTDSNRSVFLHGTYSITDALEIEGGLRYSDDSSSYRFNRYYLASLFGSNIGDPLVTPRTYKTASDRADYKVGLDYKLSPDAMAYASVSTGYKAGGINPRPLSDATVTTFAPEELISYEMGVKTEWFDKRLKVNLAGFFSQYTNLQLSTAQATATGTVIGYRNVGKVDLSGIEADIVAKLSDSFSIEASGSYLHYRALELGGAAYSASNTDGVIPGAPLANAPTWKGSLGVQYRLPVTIANGGLTARADATFRSRTYFDNQGTLAASQPDYGLLNLGLVWTSEDGAWRVAATADNVLDRGYYVSMSNLTNSTGMLTGVPGSPRRLLFTVRRTFGG